MWGREVDRTVHEPLRRRLVLRKRRVRLPEGPRVLLFGPSSLPAT